MIDLEKDDDDYDKNLFKINLDDNEKKEDTKNKKNKELNEQDPYFKEDNNSNEHERFHDAEDRLEKKYRKKVTTVCFFFKKTLNL